MIEFCVTLCIVALAGLLWAEDSDSQTLKWWTKPLASAAFVGIALAGGAREYPYGQAILVGLLLSMLGDILLIPAGAVPAFQLGAASFLAGHVAYCFAFVWRGIALAPTLQAGVLVAAVAVAVLWWLIQVVPDGMRTLVFAYVAVISTMLALAAGTYAAHGNAYIVVGALMFYVSDLSVARDRFVGEHIFNRLWGLPLYYGGQILLALSAAG